MDVLKKDDLVYCIDRSKVHTVVGVVEGLPERYDLYYTIKIDNYYSLFNKDHLIKIEEFPEDVIEHKYCKIWK